VRALDSVVVVGAGAAGVAAAETLRADGFSGSLTLLGEEPELPYDRPPLSKQVLAGVWDAERTRLRDASHYAGLGIGAGFLGMEVAAAARGLGLDVCVVDPLGQPMIRQVGPLIGAAIARLHRDHGVDLRTGTGVSSLRGDSGAVSEVVLTTREVLPADCVLVAIGAVPATEWLHGSGLPLGDGVECDQYCQAAPGIYAAGDVASWVNPRYRRRMRIEHRMNATEQGTAAAQNLLGGDVEPFAPLPYFWTDQYTVKIQVHGHLADGCQATIEEGSPGDGRFVAVFREDGQPTAVLGWNAAARMPAYRKLLLDAG